MSAGATSRSWTWVLGLDPGVRDNNGIAVLGWRPHDPVVYVAQAYAFSGAPTDLAIEVQRLSHEYDFARIVCDEGGMGKAFAEEMRRRFHIPVEPALKQAKAAAIRLMNGELRRGHVKVVGPQCTKLLDEWRDLPWREDGMREAEGYPCDVADAALYAWRACVAFVEQAQPPAPTNDERLRAEADALEEAAEREAEREARGEWWM